MRFFIEGDPKPQSRPRKGFAGHMYSPVSDWKKICIKKIKDVAYYFDGKYEQAIKVDLEFYFKRPKCHYRSGKFSHLLRDDAPKYHINKPDKDNLEKAVTDAMSDAGLIKDDCIIVSGNTGKNYCDEGDDWGCMVEIIELE